MMMNLGFNTALARDLTTDQAAAASDPAEEILCIACAGSGKSRTLAYRVARLLHEGAGPEGIVVFTFSNRAADSIKRRIASVLVKVGLSPNLIGQMYVGTIHAYCQRVLGNGDATLRQFDVLDDSRLKLYLMSRYPELAIDNLRRIRTKPGKQRPGYFSTIQEVAKAWYFVQNEGVSMSVLRTHDAALAETMQKLKDCMERDQFIDFSEMIRQVVDKAEARDPGVCGVLADVRHLLVDEYQDVSTSEERLIRLMRGSGATLFVVGDDDQAIYSFRGSDVSNILNFRDRYPNAARHTLTVNFRSTGPIVEIADQFVKAELGAGRLGKKPIAHMTRSPRHIGLHWFDHRDDEAGWVADRIQQLLGTRYEEHDGTARGLTPADLAILLHSTKWKYSGAFAEALEKRGLPFTMDSGRGVFDRPEVAALNKAFELLRDESPDRILVDDLVNSCVRPAFPRVDPDAVREVFSRWGRRIHAPPGSRDRVYPQNLIYDLLGAFGLALQQAPDDAMRDLGMFSRVIEDVESVFLSIDSTERFTAILNFLQQVAPEAYRSDTSDIVSRPDAVTLATVHKVKGLEYPAVFLADCEQQRFPWQNRKYDGWVPDQIANPITSRGAYTSNVHAEARLFYTALTRSERFLYVTGSEDVGQGRKKWKPSKFALRLQHDEIEESPSVTPAGLKHAKPRRRIDETVLPTSFSEIRHYLRCPRDYQFRQRFGFSPAVPEMFGYGRAVHVAIEKLHEKFPSKAPSPGDAAQVAGSTFHLKHVFPSRSGSVGPFERARDKAKSIAARYVQQFGNDFNRSRQVEATFEIPARDCLITGAIDLLLTEDAQGTVTDAQVIDFKSMEHLHDPNENPNIEMTELALQVQLYAKAAREVLGSQVRIGSIHFLKDNKRFDVPVDDDSVKRALDNVEWAVAGILNEDFPMRPEQAKCDRCDFRQICARKQERFRTSLLPPMIRTGSNNEAAVPAVR